MKAEKEAIRPTRRMSQKRRPCRGEAAERGHEAQLAAPQGARLQQGGDGRRRQRGERRSRHAEARPVADAQRQHIGERHLRDGGEEHVAAGRCGITAATQQRRQKEVRPDEQRAGEEHMRIGEGMVERPAFTAQQAIKRRRHRPGEQGEEEGEHGPQR